MSLSLLSLHSIAAKDAAIERVLFYLEGLEETFKENLKRVSDCASFFQKILFVVFLLTDSILFFPF